MISEQLSPTGSSDQSSETNADKWHKWQQMRQMKARNLKGKSFSLEDLILFVMSLFLCHLLRAPLNLWGVVFTY